jgi:hypothetical protein
MKTIIRNVELYMVANCYKGRKGFEYYTARVYDDRKACYAGKPVCKVFADVQVRIPSLKHKDEVEAFANELFAGGWLALEGGIESVHTFSGRAKAFFKVVYSEITEVLEHGKVWYGAECRRNSDGSKTVCVYAHYGLSKPRNEEVVMPDYVKTATWFDNAGEALAFAEAL